MYNKVVIIDDSSLDRLVTEYVLKTSSLVQDIVIFDAVLPALAYLKQCEQDKVLFPDFIFLDLQMPVMDGFDFLDNFTAFPEEVRKVCNVVTLSSSTDVKDRERAERYAAVKKFFNKPLSQAHLAAL